MANAKTKWKAEFVSHLRHARVTTFHATREAAMQAMYNRLDLAQRDAIQFDGKDVVDAYGRERGVMASSWQTAVRSTGTIFRGNFVTISRNHSEN